MKFKGIVIGMLSVILAINAIMAGVLITEAKKQTTIALTQAQLSAWEKTYEQERIGYAEWSQITDEASKILIDIDK